MPVKCYYYYYYYCQNCFCCFLLCPLYCWLMPRQTIFVVLFSFIKSFNNLAVLAEYPFFTLFDY